jgi:calcineurin-like phosphoesterase family protein
MSGSKKWFISDLHFGHANILKYSGAYRGGTTSAEHDAWLIDQINSVVKKNDLLYILGDVAMDREGLKLMKKIKAGNRILVRGNHDIYETKEYLEYFSQVHGMISYKGTFWLTHAPIHPAELRGRYNIHGHVHQNSIPDDPRYINACVEMTYGLPQSLDELFEKHKTEVWERRQAMRAAEKAEL